MFDKLKETLPKPIAERARAIRDDVRDLRDDAVRMQGQAKDRVIKAASAGREKLWEAETDALSRTAALLDRADEVPVVGKAAEAASRLVHQRLDNLRALPIDGFEEMNAKDAASAARGVEDRLALRLLREFEAAGKNRKTVLSVIDAKLAPSA